MADWLKDVAKWEIGNTLYLSVPFTWLLEKARKMALHHVTRKGKVKAGGPAVVLMPEYLNMAECNQPCPVEPLLFHNPLATFTSRGCINNCGFCAVPKMEGQLREFENFRPAPIICDNNLLATSKKHFDHVIDVLKVFPFCDFNQGLEARLLKPGHIDRIAELKAPKIRFAFDSMKEETEVFNAIKMCKDKGIKNISVYVLIGFNDDPDSAKYRLEKVIEWGAMPNPMRFQPLNSLIKNDYVGKNWTHKTLVKYMRYYTTLSHHAHMGIENWENQKKSDNALLEL